jgi:hypothetical protein
MPQPYNLVLGNETLELQFTLASIDWFKAKSGQPFLKGITDYLAPDTVVWMLLAGVRKSRPKLSYEDMQEILQKYLDDGGSFPEVTGRMFKALRAQGLLRPDDEGEGEGNRPPRALNA